MVIDRSGFLVIYPSFSDATDERDIKMKHLGSKVWIKLITCVLHA